MLVLGVDPGTRITGFGGVERRRGRFVCLAADLIRPDPTLELPDRLLRLHDGLVAAVDRLRPDAIAVEDCFYGRNVRSTLKLGHVKGLVLLIAARYRIPVAEYAPRRVKQAVVGNGNATKEQVRFMVERMVTDVGRVHAATNGAAARASLDVTDALAVAVCHHHLAEAPVLSRNAP